ncbi:hypothetical protein BGW39_003566 [Mortierella sp. 14UC]|nr:hypothetical protein BGW39_003566 [Mortierella sp. 14UC]
MTYSTVTAALTIAEQDIFATSAEWDTPQSSHASESIRRMSSRIPEPSDQISSASDAEAQEHQQQSESDCQAADIEYDISQDRQFLKFLHRFGGNRKSRQ